MTHLPPLVPRVCIASAVLILALPFARREDWLGYIALATITVAALALWGLAANEAKRAILGWYRDKPILSDDPRIGRCHADYNYSLSWDHERFSVHAFRGEVIAEVPLASILEVLDFETLLIHHEIVVRTDRRHVAFPKSRSAYHHMVRLVEALPPYCPQVRYGLERLRARFLRRSALWLPVSSLTLACLVSIAALAPTPKPPTLGWLLLGISYGLAWYWTFWRFAYSLALLLAARRLRILLRRVPRPEPTA